VSPAPQLRAARDEDSAGVIALISAVYAEYPGNVLDVATEERGLLAPASSFERFWVLEREGEVAGCIAAVTRQPGRRLELKKCYLAPDLRGQGWGRRLMDCVEDYARAQGCAEIELWSDTRFVAGHRAYLGVGYVRTGALRELHDLSHSIEWHFLKRLR
jgi:putative acetyltransferase